MQRLLIFVFAYALWASSVCAETLSPTALLEMLQGGGRTIYFRHAETDWSQSDNIHHAGDWRSCDSDKMRQLSNEGRKTAENVGIAIRTLKIPIGEMLSSEYCRAVETAEKMNLGSVSTTMDIMNLRAASFVGGENAAIKRLRKILSKPPAKNTNRVITAHGNLARAATGAYPVEGGAVIIIDDKNSEDGFRVLGIIAPKIWLELAGLKF